MSHSEYKVHDGIFHDERVQAHDGKDEETQDHRVLLPGGKSGVHQALSPWDINLLDEEAANQAPNYIDLPPWVLMQMCLHTNITNCMHVL
jgi:hypothetical protein